MRGFSLISRAVITFRERDVSKRIGQRKGITIVYLYVV